MADNDKNAQETQPTSAVVQQFKGIPMGELIGGPLRAACDAQLDLADAFFTYVNKLAFDDGGKTRLLELDVNQPVDTPNGTEIIPTHVQAPLLGLVPVPALLVENVDVSFQMEVTSSEQTKAAQDNTLDTNVNANFRIPFCGSGSVSIQGKVSSSRENTRSTNQTAKYQVSVNARQQPPTEGMSKLMDIMASCTGATKK